jgi:hypothetical protein
MANGDIKLFGQLYLNGIAQNPVDLDNGYVPPSYADTPNFTFKDTSNHAKAWKWLEFTQNERKKYICCSGMFFGVDFNKLKNNEKKIILDNKTYELRMPTVEEWQFILDNGYLGQINNKSFGSGYSFAATSTYVKPGEKYYREDLEYIYAAAYSYTLPDSGIDFIAIDTNFSSSIIAIPILIISNNSPTINGEDKDLGNKTSNFSITYSVNDNDVADELTVNEKLNGDIIRTLKNPVKGNELTLTISEERFANLRVNSTNTIEIEVTDGQATAYRRYTFVKTNSAPFITYTGQTDLGQLTTKPSITYTVRDNEGDAITVTEKLNGEVINQFSATTNTNYTVGITDTFWLTCGSNTNTVEIIASDALGGSSSKTITFSRKITKLQIVMKNAIETDAKATKILVSPQWTTTGGVGKVEVCNNGFDSNPVWEDMTTMSVLNRPYTFTNSTKTAAKWGIKIRLTLTKNEGYEGEVAIYGFGGAFE